MGHTVKFGCSVKRVLARKQQVVLQKFGLWGWGGAWSVVTMVNAWQSSSGHVRSKQKHYSEANYTNTMSLCMIALLETVCS